MKSLYLLVLSLVFCGSSFAASLIERCEADILSGYINNGMVISAADFEARIDTIEGTVDIPSSVACLPGVDLYEEMCRRLVDLDGIPQGQTARNILDAYEKATDKKRKYFIGALVSMLYDRIK